MYSMQHVVDSYKQSKHRLLLLDYDGTLVNIASTPEKAVPTPKLLTLLKMLAADKHNEVVVISGRSQKDLDNFLGDLDIGLAAEHGFFIKYKGSSWQVAMETEYKWWTPIKDVMKKACKQLPGSFIEEKNAALTWHYRLADQTKAITVVQALVANLKFEATGQGIKVLLGHKVVEVGPTNIDKGVAAARWLNEGDFDFILAAGDDVTDEHLFRVLPDEAYSIKIGEPPTAANLLLHSPASVLELLDHLAKHSSADN